MANTVTIYLVGNGSATISAPSTALTVECFAAGQSANDGTGQGGTGGGYARGTLSPTTGATLTFNLGAPGVWNGAVGNGGDTWLSTTGAQPTSTAQGVLAAGGGSTTTQLGSLATYTGGAGGVYNGGTGGGGGAAGPMGNGQPGGAGGTNSGGGGGGNGGGSSGFTGGTGAGANGGNGYRGTGGTGGTATATLGTGSGAPGGPGAGGGGAGYYTSGVTNSAGKGGDDWDYGGGGAGGATDAGAHATGDYSYAANGGTPGGGGSDDEQPSGGVVGQGGWSVIKITYQSTTDSNQTHYYGTITSAPPQAALHVIQGGNTLSGSGTVAGSSGPVTGTLTATQAAQTLAGTATVAVAGSLTQTQGNQTIFGSASVLVAGSLNATQGAQTLSGTATVTSPADDAALTLTQAAQTLAGSASAVVSGALHVTQGAQTGAGTASVVVAGALNETQAPNTVVLSGVYAHLIETQQSQTLAGTASGAITAALNLTQQRQGPAPRPMVPVRRQLTQGVFTPLPQPIMAGGANVYMLKEMQRINSALQTLLAQAPQAATQAPTQPVDGMVRLARYPWWPLPNQTTDQWVYYDGASSSWKLAGWTAPTSTGASP